MPAASSGKAAASSGKAAASSGTAAASSGKAQMRLYSATSKARERPVLEVYDAENDPLELSSRLVKRCAWVAHAPASLLGKELAGPNVACCELRNALDPSSKSKRMNGINKNVVPAVQSRCVMDIGVPAVCPAVAYVLVRGPRRAVLASAPT